ncbi:MAG: BatD family protein [Pseudomonadota bacterium]
MGIRIFLCALCLMSASIATAEVYVALDRESVQANESFTLILVADNGEEGEPIIDGLTENFDVLGRNQRNNITIRNGQSTASRRWTYVLLPKGAGEFVIPPLTVGGASSEPVSISVREATVEAPGEADVFFEVSLDKPSSWVQAEVMYTVKLYLGVATRQTMLSEPVIEGGEVLVERLPEDKRYESQVGSRLYTVLERRYALFPQTSGDLTIAPARFSASLWERGRISNQRVFTSEPLSLEVKPTVPPPAAFPNAVWLPASNLSLAAELRPQDGILEPGEPANVRLKVTAAGLLPEQLPELTLTSIDGLRVYPDQPDLQQRVVNASIESTRQQGFAVIAARGGVFELPSVSMPWFNTDAAAWEVAELSLPALRAAGVVSGISPAPQPAAAETVAAVEDDTTSVMAEDVPVDVETRSRIFRLKVLNYLFLGGWLITLWLLWRMQTNRKKQRKKSRREAIDNAPFRTAQKAFKQVHKACGANNPDAARVALLAWARAFWQDERIRTLGDVARRMPATERAAVETLSRYFYSPERTAWEGKPLYQALLNMNRPGAESKLANDGLLPPLLGTDARV